MQALCSQFYIWNVDLVRPWRKIWRFHWSMSRGRGPWLWLHSSRCQLLSMKGDSWLGLCRAAVFELQLHCWGCPEWRWGTQSSGAAIKFSCPWFVGLNSFYVSGNSGKLPFFHMPVIWQLQIAILPQTLEYFTCSFWSYFVTPCYYDILPLRKLDCS